MDDILKQVTDFARQAHGSQTRKFTPEPYIVHPIRVMEVCREYTNDITILSAALLHDVIEDTPVARDDIRDFLATVMDGEKAERTTKLVEELTDVYIKKDYPKWNRRTRKSKEVERLGNASADAQTIKYADILDNSREIVNHETDFAGVFLYEGRALLKAMTKGNKELRQKTVETVESGIKHLTETQKKTD